MIVISKNNSSFFIFVDSNISELKLQHLRNSWMEGIFFLRQTGLASKGIMPFSFLP